MQTVSSTSLRLSMRPHFSRPVHGQVLVWLILLLVWLLPHRLAADTTSLSNATEITSVPYTVSAPGLYYLSQNLSVITTYVNAISINADGVTIDLNGHTISNLAVGMAAYGTGIYAPNHSRLTIRNGVIRGFTFGIYAPGGGFGHLIENVRFTDSTYAAVRIDASGSIIRHCQAWRIGGSTVPGYSPGLGLFVVGWNNTVLDCDVSGAVGAGGNAMNVGIYVANGAALVLGNRVDQATYGVYFDNAGGKYRDNLCAASVTTPYLGGTDAGNN